MEIIISLGTDGSHEEIRLRNIKDHKALVKRVSHILSLSEFSKNQGTLKDMILKLLDNEGQPSQDHQSMDPMLFLITHRDTVCKLLEIVCRRLKDHRPHWYHFGTKRRLLTRYCRELDCVVDVLSHLNWYLFLYIQEPKGFQLLRDSIGEM